MNTKLMKNVAAAGVRKAWSLARADESARKVIFCLHSVNPAASHSTIHPDSFDRIVAWLTTHTDVMDVESLLDADRTGNTRPAVALTFDDGHRDNLTHALPIVRHYGATFTAFVTVGAIERDARAVNRFKSVLRQETADFELLSWDDAEELIANGCMIGSHTWDHPMLSHLSDEGIEFQLRASKEVITKRLGLTNIGMCYPYGKFGRNVDERVVRATERAGYTYGLCVEHRGVAKNEGRFAIPRFIINDGNLDMLSRQVSGQEDYHGMISRRMPGFLAKMLSPTDYHEADDALVPLSAFSPPT